VKTAVIILFHGSKVERAGETVRRIIHEVRRKGKYWIVEEAYLQHAKPGLRDAIQRCVQQGIGNIVIVPFFLQMGTHVTADIPLLVAEARKRYADLQITTTEAVGSHPLMVDIVMDLAGKDIC
jgi:sirohydrochlorin ferrochelatase